MTEPVVEWVIRLCGWSAILFVLAIFAFVFREAVPIVWQGFDFREFFFSHAVASRFRDVRSTESWRCWPERRR